MSIFFVLALLAPVAAEPIVVDGPPDQHSADGTWRPGDGERNPAPKTLPKSWIPRADIPKDLIQSGRGGATEFVLDVGKGGEVIACTVTSSTATPPFDKLACSLLLERAQFSPALDETGQAVAGRYSSRVIWPKPQPRPNSFADTVSTMSFVVGADGVIRNCEFDEQGEPNRFFGDEGESPCDDTGTVEPFRDKDGHPVERGVRVRFSVELFDSPVGDASGPAPRHP